eukprot:scaffold160205_cov36-Tisochrysis_lutea.AAC.1
MKVAYHSEWRLELKAELILHKPLFALSGERDVALFLASLLMLELWRAKAAKQRLAVCRGEGTEYSADLALHLT